MSDENFNGDIVRGLLRQQPDLNIVRVQDIDIRTAVDPEVLDRAAVEGLVLLTHDRKTMPNFAFQRVARGEKMPGVLVVKDRMPLGQAIDEILLYAHCASPDELEGQVKYVPMP